MTIALSTIGSRGVTLTIGPSALREAPDGAALELTLHDGPLVLTLSTRRGLGARDRTHRAASRDARGAVMATLTLPGADIRGYYHQLGIHLPERTNVEASVRCFADPGSHRREDREPSCSINLINGAWQCHGCGARGGAYDAALAKSYTPRSAIDLMIAHGLIERRARLRTARELLHPSDHASAAGSRARAHARATEDLAARPSMQVTEQDIARWQRRPLPPPALLARLARERGWRFQTMRALQLGLDRGRITIPIRGAHGQLRGLLRYQPEHTQPPQDARCCPAAASGSSPTPLPRPPTGSCS